MEINNMRLSRLKNEEHFQFQTEFDELINRYTAATLKVEQDYAAYQSELLKEKQAIGFVAKSDLTEVISNADEYRDSISRGMHDAVSAATNHYSEEVRQAALRIKIVLDDFGNLGTRAYNEESAAITSLVQKITDEYAADMELVNLTGWVNELDTANKTFMDLMKQRYEQEAGQTLWRMKEVRIDVDAAYRNIVKRINALIVVEGPGPYQLFVSELNTRIDRYTNGVNQRQGKTQRDNEPQMPT